MAQETVIHRIDAELAAGLPVTAVPGDLALDGVDEVLKRFLGYDAEDLDQLKGGHLARRRPGHDHGAGGPDRVDGPSVTAGGRGRGRRQRQPARGVQAAPEPMLRWLWGRAGDEVVRLTGEPAWAAYLRRMLAAATQ